jgi:PAS domain S-box-containing protein
MLHLPASERSMETRLDRVEATHRKTESHLLALFGQAAVGMSETDLQGRFLRANDRYCELVGRTREELLRLQMQDITHPDDLATNLSLFTTATETGSSFVVEKRYVRPDGSVVWVNNSVAPIRDAEGRLQSILAVTVDITERKRTEAALAASEERYRLVVASFQGATYDTDLETGYAYRAPRFYEMLGVRPADGEPTRDWWFRRIHPEDAPRFHDALSALLEDRAAELDLEFRVRHEHGGWIWVWQRGLAVRDGSGRPKRTVGAVLDITERKRAEEAVRRSETRYRRLMAQSPLSVQTVGPEGRIREVNKAWEDLFGVMLADIPDYNIHEDAQLDARGIRPILDRAFAGEAVELSPTVYVPDRGRYAGRDLWTRAIAYPVTDDAGHVEEVVLIHQDITVQTHAEAALRESEARFRHMADSAPALIWMTDAEGQVTFANMHFEYVFGRPAATMHGNGWRDVIEPPDVKAFRTAFRDAWHTRRPFRAEVRVRDKHDRTRWLRCEGVPRLNDAGQYLGYTGCALDITDVKLAQGRLELLINELNHRVKNTLATVQSIAWQTLRSAPSTEQARDTFDARLMALSRAHDVLTRENWEGASLREIVAQAIEPYGSHDERRFEVTGPEVRLPPRMALSLAMALQELATNAVKYGALSKVTGRVRIAWTLHGGSGAPRLRLAWEEMGGPPVSEPTRRGFGSRLIERSLAQDLDGEVRMTFAPTGVVCAVDTLIARRA